MARTDETQKAKPILTALNFRITLDGKKLGGVRNFVISTETDNTDILVHFNTDKFKESSDVIVEDIQTNNSGEVIINLITLTKEKSHGIR